MVKIRNNDHLYKKGYIVDYKDGEKSLEREKIKYVSDVGDRVYEVLEGDTLTYLSTKFYGVPNYWYLIADVNEVDNPFYLKPGSRLIIPSINRYKL